MEGTHILEGRTAVVTGAGRNVGRGIAETFAEEGASVVVNDIDEGRARTVADSLDAAEGQRHRALVADASDPDAVQEAARTIEADYGTVDVLVNNAAYTVNKTVFDTTVEEWHQVIDVTLTSVFLWTKYVGPLVVEADDGCIINLASKLGHRARTRKAAYCAAKAGVVNLTRQLSLDLAEHGVRVNSITPALVGTPVTYDTDVDDRDPDSVPLGRIGRPRDIANAAVFLASDRADYITGEDLPVDGGL